MQSPLASECGAVSAQSGGIGPSFAIPNVRLREKALEYAADGVALEDAVPALLNVDDGQDVRQVHGVDSERTFVHTGENCGDWAGHEVREGFTVAGNLLFGRQVVSEVAETFETANPDDPLGERLINALEAGHKVGGDKRDHLPIHSGAVRIESTEYHAPLPYHRNVRVDATETPIEDLRQTYRRAKEGYEMIGADYEDPV
jgi:uncharacterized Ntn-hydrolase superfamily protein